MHTLNQARSFLTTLETVLLYSPYAHIIIIKPDVQYTYTGCVCEPSLVMTPSLSISICLNVLTFCRISSSVYLNDGHKDTTVSGGSHLKWIQFQFVHIILNCSEHFDQQ